MNERTKEFVETAKLIGELGGCGDYRIDCRNCPISDEKCYCGMPSIGRDYNTGKGKVKDPKWFKEYAESNGAKGGDIDM